MRMKMKDQAVYAHLNYLRDWAQEKISAGSEPPWAWFQYMKLIEVADTLLWGMGATSPLQVVDENYRAAPLEVDMLI